MGLSYGESKLILSWFLSIYFLASFSCAFDLTGHYHIDCGSHTNTSIGSRVFVSDSIASNFLSTFEDVLAYKNSTASSESAIPASYSPLYRTARIFTKPLHFTPFAYQNYDMSAANFSVLAQNRVLLAYFSIHHATRVKEFSINVASDSLVVSFIPLANSFAFLNAIEVVSLPDELVADDMALNVDTLDSFDGLSTQALETVARVNMGGLAVSYENDTLWRTWDSDHSFRVTSEKLVKNVTNIKAVKYIHEARSSTPYVAPSLVYGTATAMNVEASNPGADFNITWEFKVDRGFRYLFRFHLCDIVSTALNTLYFNAIIDSWNVAVDIDLSMMSSNALGSAVYLDYVTALAIAEKLRVSIGPSTLAGVDRNAILNGLEMMKINNSMGNLGVMDSPFFSSQSNYLKKNLRVLAIGSSIGLFLLLSLTIWLKNNLRVLFKGMLESSVGVISNYGSRISFLEVQEATNNFEDSRVIGSGGFGKVYRGILKDGTKVAVKRKNLGSQQGLVEFRTEIEMLSHFRHRHLVSLIGYCDEGNEMVLVYEFVENGTLRSRLRGSELPALSWKQRLEICIGAARGLHYLHTGFDKAIIHRDVKSGNILLDENLSAKVADFGLSKIGPDVSHQADHVSTAVKGSFGYFDPEYFRKCRLTVKSDVYSFGVVLFEVLCGRAAVDATLPTEKIGLAGWAMNRQMMGKLDDIVDPALVGEIQPNSLKKFGEIAKKCLAEYGANRPSMGQVLRDLECALQLQEAESVFQVDRKLLEHSVSAYVNGLSRGCKLGRYNSL